ncbi:serine/threonine-protein kinase [Nonomuraea sp. NPDC050310]|uniref:serine/threonine-protein kinase n=1 Tax=Nonomuraea sp. NPDC050310 TaxID=3154935 RepID=UPI0033EA687C
MTDGEMPDQLLGGRYRLDERIAHGPLGEVWRAYDQQADWPVAVRTVEPGVDAVTRGRVTRRARTLAAVLHPNVVTVLDVGERYVVMEHLSGESLAEVGAPLPAEQARAILLQLVAGLDAAHRGGVVHGDLKPADVRKAGSGVFKITGFGLAGDGLPLPDELAAPESPYQAPEQRGGDTGRAADLYALGAIAFELLTGQPPAGRSAGSSAGVPSTGDRAVPAGSGDLAGVPVELRRLVLALLAADPTARPSLAAVRQALAPHQDTAVLPQLGTGVHSGAGGTTPLSQTAIFDSEPADPVDRPDRRMLVQLGIALALIVVATAVFALWPRGGDGQEALPEPTPTAEVTPTETAEPTPTPTPTPTPSSTPATTPDSPVQQIPAQLQDGPPGGWGEFVGRLHEAVGIHEGRGEIDPRVADKAHRGFDKAMERLREGRTDKGVAELQKTAAELAKARDRGEVPPTGPLADLLDRFGLW